MLAEALAIFVMLAILSALIIVHEFGHFSVARLFGFQTPVFGFGLPFGPSWTLGKWWGTQFKVHACLLGGYVAIPELGDESNQDAFADMELLPFRKFPIWQRALVAFAGVGFNMLFAYLIMIILIVSLGQPLMPTMVDELDSSNPIAGQAGVRAGDRLQSVDGVEISSMEVVIGYLTHHKNQPVTLTVVRDGQPIAFHMSTNQDGRVGMRLSPGPMTYKKVAGSPLHIAKVALVQLWQTTWSMIDNLIQMIQGLFSTAKSTPGHPKLGWQDLHGVLAILKIGADIAKQDWTQLFMFTVLISMDLAIVNLVPWPALDGWHLATMFLEAVRGKPMGERAQGEMVKWGFVSLLVLMAVIMVNDVTALMSGKLEFRMSREKNSKAQPAAPAAQGPGAGDSKPAPAPEAGQSQPASSSSSSSQPASTVIKAAPAQDLSQPQQPGSLQQSHK